MATSQTLEKIFLSGSTDGRAIKVAATATPGTLLHTAHATSKDEVYLEAQNNDGSSRTLTIEMGGTTDPDDIFTQTIYSKVGWVPILNGQPLSNSVVTRAFASAANVITIRGFVHRIG